MTKIHDLESASLRSAKSGLTRRSLLLGAASLAFAPALSAKGSFPSRPLRLVVPFAPGGGTDTAARVLADALARELGQPVVVENRGGAGGTIGMEYVARADPDGYTLVLATNGPIVTGKVIYPSLAFDPQVDLLPVSAWFSQDNVLSVSASSRFQSIQDWITAANDGSKPLMFGTAGVGSTLHIIGELFQARAAVRMTHVPYRGGAAAMIDLLAGSVDGTIDSLPSVVPQATAGKIRVLVNFNGKRSRFLPDVPTLSESGFDGFSEFAWGGIFVPKSTPPDIVSALSQAIVRAGGQSEVKRKMSDVFCDVVTSDPQTLSRRVQEETARWVPVVREAGIQA